MFHLRLKDSTQDAHLQLERLLVGRIKEIRTQSEYADLLQMFYGFYSPLESRIERVITPAPGLDFQSRRKASSIRRDLSLLNRDMELSVCEDLPPVETYHQALGALYVLEGSTLGGQVIAKLIRKQLDGESDTPLAFFLYYGDDVMRMWENFKSCLLQDFSSDEEREIITTANNTFLTFTHWVEQHAAKKL